MDEPGYSHRQRSPLCLLLYGMSIAILVGMWIAREESPVALTLAASGILGLVFATGFHHLSVADQGDSLLIQFGPLPVFRRTVRYEDIEDAEVGRTLFIDGWGIHYSVRGGWVWNLWGRDCVAIRLKNGGRLWIGTDDPENLASFLKMRIADA